MEIITAGMVEFFEKRKYVALKNVFKKMNDINYSVVKGVPLKLLCGSRTTDIYADVDILLDRKSIGIVNTILNQNDYYNNTKRENRIFALTSTHQTMPYSKIYNSHEKVDINFDIFWGEYEGKRIDIDEFLSDAIEIDIYGIKVKTLPPIKAIVQLILHHYKDMNSIFLLATRKSIKYDMFYDLYNIIKNNEDIITIEKLYKTSEMYGIKPYVYYMLYYTRQVIEDELLKKYVEAFRSSEGEALLNCYGLCAEEQRNWRYDFKTRLEAKNLYHLIENDLTEQDKKKIAINKHVFLGE